MATPVTSRAGTEHGRVRFGLFEFDPRAGELWREGRLVKLSPQPARVLALLLAHPGEVVLRDEFRDHLWGSDTFVDFERGLNFCVLQVRTALADSSDNPRFVQTVPRRGYRFIAPVVPAIAPAGPTLHATPDTVAEERPVETEPVKPAMAVSRGWRTSVAFAATLAVTLAALAWLIPRSSAPVAGSGSDRLRVAVLPIATPAGDEATELLADGLTDELITQLGQLSPRRLAVIARTSAMTYRRSPKSIADVGRELDVRYVVESSLRRDGATLRISSKLIPVADQTPSAAWEEIFDTGGGGGVLSSTRAGFRLARLVAGELLPRDAVRSEARAPGNPAAWEQFMRGRALMNRGTTADAQQAIGAFEAATNADAAFAPAWAKLAEARHLLVMMGATRPLDAYPFARDEATRAVAADDRLADGYLAEGLVALWFDWNPAIAAARFERAIALNNSHAAARHDYAWALVALGRDEEAIREITMARDLDPVSVRANNDIGWLYLELGRAADAERACEHTVALDASALEAQACLERAYTQRGLWDAALAAARTTMPAAAFDALAARGGTSQDMVRALWQWRLERLEQAARTRWISPYTLAVQHVLVGNHDRAIDALERARDEKNGMLVFLARDPALDPLRENPRFRAFSARVLGPSEAGGSGVLEVAGLRGFGVSRFRGFEVRQPRNLEPRNLGTP